MWLGPVETKKSSRGSADIRYGSLGPEVEADYREHIHR